MSVERSVRAVSAPDNPPHVWLFALKAAAVLAAAMGLGRFAYTPILPLMESQTALTAQSASLVATANYLGYLVGAVIGMLVPRWGRVRRTLQAGGLLLIASMLLMPLAERTELWLALRFAAGAGSAAIFIVAGNVVLTTLARRDRRTVGWAYGGIGVGIAASGLLVAAVTSVGDWRAAWIASGLATAALILVGWDLGPRGGTAAKRRARPAERRRRRLPAGLLIFSYFLEGAGYIILGTFLVAVVGSTQAELSGGGVWTLAGLAAIPSVVLWTWMSRHASRPALLTCALLLQALASILPVVSASSWAAVLAAVLFGGTFVGIVTLTLAAAADLGVPGGVATLTAAYSVGQVLGPLIVVPVLGGGYGPALVLGAAVLLLAAACTAVLTVRKSPPLSESRAPA
ncbi:YbfB/YjiJ family MFS transporter [Nesterenkonia sp. NBAIMH1]|uniref:YbfB/YjiJ family MFS transporter n=1 Tax=Nesterenkonia sp. NBAIMH1 TaxID=2600320 RepID=UPI0011B82910|nr:YbfB/YjiJ family MFS transporter [Nesterenkonia sp. NBAIMH1]